MKLFYIATLIVFLAACNNSAKKEGSEADSANAVVPVNVDAPAGDPAKAKKITERDYSVTAANAYNDMFLDSLAMEKYITTRQLGDKKIAGSIRSFYNARNYQ